MIAGPAPCYNCKHFRGSDRRTCDAFPDGIPAHIFWGAKSHDNHYPGDRGIRFEEVGDHSEVTLAEVGPTSDRAVSNRDRKRVADHDLNITLVIQQKGARLLDAICRSWNVHSVKKIG